MSYFNGDDASLSEAFMDVSDDDLGMEDEYSESSEEESEECSDALAVDQHRPGG